MSEPKNAADSPGQWKPEYDQDTIQRLRAALAESERRRVELIDRHEAERRVLAADVCRQADRAEAAEKEAERQRMFWEGIRDARVDAAERSLVGARAMADDFKRRADEHATLQAAAERDRDALRAEVGALKEDARRDCITHVAMVEAFKGQVAALRSRCEALGAGLTELVIAIGEEVRARPPLPAKPLAFTTLRLEQADLRARSLLSDTQKEG